MHAVERVFRIAAEQDARSNVSDLSFTLIAFDDLTTRQIYDIMHLRDLVFVVGQKITAVPEVDGEDPKCLHVRCHLGEKLVGTIRIFSKEDPMVVSRVAIHTDFQGRGFGRQMMGYVNDWLGERAAEMHAQSHLEVWYASLGWERVGEAFEEAEIPHVTMRWPAGSS